MDDKEKIISSSIYIEDNSLIKIHKCENFYFQALNCIKANHEEEKLKVCNVIKCQNKEYFIG